MNKKGKVQILKKSCLVSLAAYACDRKDYRSSQLQTTVAGVRIAPSPSIALTLDYEYNDFKRVASECRDRYTTLITGGTWLAWDAAIQGSFFTNTIPTMSKTGGMFAVAGSSHRSVFIYIVFNDTSFSNTPVQSQSAIIEDNVPKAVLTSAFAYRPFKKLRPSDRPVAGSRFGMLNCIFKTRGDFFDQKENPCFYRFSQVQ